MKPIQDFDLWSANKKFLPEAKKVIQNIRNSEPARKVKSGMNNVYGFYPSRKMGLTIQFESHKLELAGIYEKEHDSQVIEYYDQPPTFTIRYLDKGGKRRGHRYTADYFVIEKNWIGWEEWKPEAQLEKLSLQYPSRYVKDASGKWSCPPAEEYANNLGLSFRVISSKDVNWIYQRNIQFLEDYLIDRELSVPETSRQEIMQLINITGSITLGDLLENEGLFTVDDVYTLIGLGEIYVDLYNYPITEYNKFPIFNSKENAQALFNSKESQTNKQFIPQLINVYVSQKISWNLKIYQVVNFTTESISLLSEKNDFIELPKSTFEELIAKGNIKAKQTKGKDDTSNEELLKAINSASPKELEDANMKFNIIQKVLNGVDPADLDVPGRTIRDWKSKYLSAQKVYGNGYIGLLPNRHKQGNRSRKIPSEVIELMISLIEQQYENKRQKNKMRVYEILVEKCYLMGVSPPSFRTFCNEVNKRSKHELTKKRQGPKAAYDTEQVYHELSFSTPRHGDMPFQICHIDHTQLDVELICSKTKRNLGRPWVSLLMDAFSRRIFAFHLTFDPPSYRSCMMLLRECVIRYSRLPKKIVVDGGKEFHSVYFDTLLARYNCAKHVRPGGKPKFGSVCERLFGIVNKDFIHNLLGNTQITKEVRKVTKSFNPKNISVWTLEELFQALTKWSYEIYDNRVHGSLDESPCSSYLRGLEKTGERKHTYTVYDETFKMLTLPSTKKGTAKVIPGQGVKINTFYYWSDSFNNPMIEGKQIPIRYDPFNIGLAYAFVNNCWIELVSHYYNILVNRTEKELKVITEEARKRKRLTQSSRAYENRDIVELLRNAETFEELQLQTLKDQAIKNTLDMKGKTENKISDREIINDLKSVSDRGYDQVDKRTGRKSIDEMVSSNTFESYEEF